MLPTKLETLIQSVSEKNIVLLAYDARSALTRLSIHLQCDKSHARLMSLHTATPVELAVHPLVAYPDVFEF